MPACPTTPTSSKDTPLHIRIKRKHEVSPLVQNGTPMGPTPMGATPMGATPKSAQKAYEVKNQSLVSTGNPRLVRFQLVRSLAKSL